ncbi:hypothetical protein FRX31_017309 [Thalictrum thalictroides]|uniref:Ubiquitin-like domain-containing protein n=1 Tax=Thalictrum thalictroides TaxID=46969 RepID=A0A7J6W9P3_THATH|nr:hypothetical protein FRX31_017309 [Thalictrum thalictroides]
MSTPDNNSKKYVIDVGNDVKTVKDLKSHFEKAHGFPSDDQIIVRQNEILYDAIRLDLLGVRVGEMELYRKISPDESVAVKISPELVEGGRLPDLVLSITGGKCVSDLKLMIQKELGVPPSRQYLTSMKIEMKNELPLREYIAEKPPRFFLKVT